MSLYVYIKKNTSPEKKIINYVSYVSLVIGSMLLFWSFYPVISFEIYSRLFIQKNLIAPVPRSEAVSSLEAANSILGSYTTFSSNLRDFTNANLWFPIKPQINSNYNLNLNKIKKYSLSIPKLNINDAKVVVGGDDLSKSLIHFLPKSLPGEYGNVVIFGHSTLPQLYNPTNYKTIFTYLHLLNKGDKIYIKIKGMKYEYEVYEMFVVKPEEISVLEQKRDASYLTLITCVPPGTFLNRLVIRSKLTKLPL